MVDIDSFIKALKAKWVVNYLNGDTYNKWKLFFYYNLQKHDGKALFQGNLNSEDVRTPAQTTQRLPRGYYANLVAYQLY